MGSRRPLGLALLVVAAGASVLAGQSFAKPWTPTRRPDRRAVPVLMYHVLADPPVSAPYPDLYVRREELQAQVRWLAAAG
jgi:hypothetical protein